MTYLFCLLINPDDPGAATGQAAALALLNRLMLCVCSLPGALIPILGGHLPRVDEIPAYNEQQDPDLESQEIQEPLRVDETEATVQSFGLD